MFRTFYVRFEYKGNQCTQVLELLSDSFQKEKQI